MIQKSDGMCFFYRDIGEFGSCGILTDTPCSGKKSKCSFYKTEKQYYIDRNKAIQLCRDRGICDDCKYCGNAPCEFFKIPGEQNV